MKAKSQKMQYTLAELIQDLEDVTIEGDASTVITGVCTIQDSQPGRIAFLMNPIYKKYLADTQASAVILSADQAVNCPVTAIISKDPYYTYAKIAAFFEQKPAIAPGIHPSAVIGEHCKIDPSVRIGPHAVIGDHVTIGAEAQIGPCTVIGDSCEIGKHTHLDANVTLYYQVIVGKNVRISSGVVLGADGFGIAKHKGVWQKVPQLGRVIIGDDVEIGANTTIDRGAIEDTVIEQGAKLDNLVQLGHNVRIGEYTAIAGCTGVAGSTTIGKNCLIGGQVGIGGHLTIADNVMITGKSAISSSIHKPGVYSSGVGGVIDNKTWRKNSARAHRLDELFRRVKMLEAALAVTREDLTESNDT